MMTDLDDDEELTFDDKPEPAVQGNAPIPEPAAEAPKAEPAPQGEAPAEAASTAPAAKPKRSLAGMAVAAGFAVCIIASIVSAVMAWRAASLVAAASEGTSARATAAKLDYLQRLVEQQRDALDGLSAKPGGAAAGTGGGEGQLNALAAAVRANQEMNERLPAMIMQQVDNKLASARPAQRPAAAAKAKPAKLAKANPKPRPVVKTAAVSKPAVPLPLQAIAAPVEPRRPAGEAIRYP